MAVKTVKFIKADDKACFLSEINIMAHLRHPNIGAATTVYTYSPPPMFHLLFPQ